MVGADLPVARSRAALVFPYWSQGDFGIKALAGSGIKPAKASTLNPHDQAASKERR